MMIENEIDELVLRNDNQYSILKQEVHVLRENIDTIRSKNYIMSSMH